MDLPLFFCEKCREWFNAEWTFGATVRCPQCNTLYETDYEIDSDENVTGPWLGKEVVESGES